MAYAHRPYSSIYNPTDTTIIMAESYANRPYTEQIWYTQPMKTKRPCWTGPLKNDDMETEPLVTFCLPIYASQDKVVGVLAVDVSLTMLSQIVYAIKPSAGSYCTLLSQDGSYIIHPDSTKLFHETVFTQEKHQDDLSVEEAGRAMVSGGKGYKYFRLDGVDSYVFFKPLGETGWSVAIVCPESDIFGGYHRLQQMVSFIVAIGLLLMLLVFSRIVTRELTPLRRLADQAGTIAEGHFEEKLPDDGRSDEIGRLSQSFGDMQHSLIRYIDELKETTATKASIESELKVASAIQVSMLPRIFPPFPERKDIDLYASMIPAKEVGGDLFDFFLRDEKLFFLIGDVSGKGAPAAMLMAVVHSLFRAASAHETDPAVIVRTINETVCLDNESNMFVTLFLGVLDLPSGHLRYCNAGHDCPVSIHDGISTLDCLPNLPVGVLSDMKYTMQECTLASGTTLFLFTDGLTEAMNADHELFGMQRVNEVLSTCTDKSPRQILDTVLDGVHAFVQEADQSDDLTMLALRYTPGQFATLLNEKLTLNCDLARIPELNDFIGSIGEKLEMDPAITSQVQLAVEEAVVNVMNYAYPEGKKKFVTIKAMSDGHELRLVIIDSGIPFDPTRKEKADTTLSVEDRPIGGLGIFLVRELMDSINYERVDGRNILMMIKIIR